MVYGSQLTEITPDIFLFKDTCHVYVVKSGSNAVLIDFGSGRVLDHLDSIGVDRVTDILMTHHHRDQGEGLPRAVQAGINIWVPHMEQDLFHSVDAFWQGREVYNNYNVREDRFSLLESVPVAGTLKDYATYKFKDLSFEVVPTPGHTPGSISLKTPDGVFFTGDLIAAPGKVWSMAATQWSYNGAQGVAATILSLLDLKDRDPKMLLPSHGQPMDDPKAAIDLLVDRLRQLLDVRGQYGRLLGLRENLFEELTPHLLYNRFCEAKSYVLLSKSGKALVIDYGYDGFVGLAAGTERAARRPWLYSLPTLKKLYGVSQVEVALLTHYHDDHVAGLNLLKQSEGTQVWAPDLFADILEAPSDYDIPCLWFDPIKVDRRLPLEQTFQWQEYEFTLYHLPGHTLYAVAIYFEVDGQKVLATGDQQGNDGHLWNYVYKNRFRMEDYRLSGQLYLQLKPDLMISGHWEPLRPTQSLLEEYLRQGEALERLHQDLLPLDEINFDAEGFGVRLTPYQATVAPGEVVEMKAEVCNPLNHKAEVAVRLIVPDGWETVPQTASAVLGSQEVTTLSFGLTVPRDCPKTGLSARRIRIAAELIAGERSFGQQAEALVSIKR